MPQYEYLIIGSNSFSGSSYVKSLLKNNKNVIGVSRSSQYKKVFLSYNNKINKKNFLFLKIDINKNYLKLVSVIKRYKIKYIINFSAQGMVEESWENPIDWYQTNLISLTKIIQEIKDFKFIKKFINFSTPEVYGDTKKWKKESDTFNPTTPYAISRAAFDSYLINLYKITNFPMIITRTANVFGPTQQLYRIIPRTIIYSILGKKLSLDGGGQSKRSFIHIHDVCSALSVLIKKGKLGETYHISTNKIVSIKKLVELILNKMKIKKNKIIKKSIERKSKDMRYMLCTKKIRNLGWKDKISLDNGLEQTIKWIDHNFKILKKCSLKYNHKK